MKWILPQQLNNSYNFIAQMRETSLWACQAVFQIAGHRDAALLELAHEAGLTVARRWLGKVLHAFDIGQGQRLAAIGERVARQRQLGQDDQVGQGRLGLELGVARAVGAILFAVLIGISMQLIFRSSETACAMEP